MFRETESGCWEWQKSLGSHGYGNIATGGQRNETVHRVSHEVFISQYQRVYWSCIHATTGSAATLHTPWAGQKEA